MKQEGSWGLREKPGRGNSTEDKKRREDLVKLSTTEKWLTTIQTKKYPFLSVTKMSQANLTSNFKPDKQFQGSGEYSRL